MKGIVITGRPGSGKTTLFNRLVESARSRGLRVGGFICPEVRRAGGRIGFRIVDIWGGAEAWLAKVDGCYEGPRIGKYHVCRDEALSVGLSALERAVGEADVIAIDEIGPMELRIPELRSAMIEALKSGKPFIVVAHIRLKDPEILALLRDAARIVVNPYSREEARRRALQALDLLLGR